MILRSHADELRFELREVVPPEQQMAGDLCIDAHIRVDGFSGRSERVWIEAPMWDAFRAALRALEKTREGEAVLGSTSPNDLRVRIRVVDRARHLEVDGHIGRYRFLHSGTVEFRLTFAFELDSEYLSAWLAEVESFAAAP